MLSLARRRPKNNERDEEASRPPSPLHPFAPSTLSAKCRARMKNAEELHLEALYLFANGM